MEFSWAWVGWLGLFAVIEGAALFNKKSGDTLSENVWRWFRVKAPSSTTRTIRMTLLGAFLGWLTIHFLNP